MFYDIKDFPFLQEIVANTDQIQREFLTLHKTSTFLDEFYSFPVDIPGNERTRHVEYWVRDNGFHPDQVGYDSRDGEWMALTIFKNGFPIKWYNVEEKFPTAYRQVMKVPQVNFSAFFRLAGEAGTKEHTHTNRNLIFHLCLFDLNGESVMNCDGDQRILKKKGDWCIFDYSKPHSSFNYSKDDRVNLIVDFTPSGWKQNEPVTHHL